MGTLFQKGSWNKEVRKVPWEENVDAVIDTLAKQIKRRIDSGRNLQECSMKENRIRRGNVEGGEIRMPKEKKRRKLKINFRQKDAITYIGYEVTPQNNCQIQKEVCL